MVTAVEIRNPLIDRVREHIDVTKDDSGRFCLTINQGGEFTATLLTRAIDALPPGSPFTVDATATSALEESVIGVIIARRNGQERTLVASNEGIEKLARMRLVTTESDGSVRFMKTGSWQIERCEEQTSMPGHPAMDVLKGLAAYVQQLEKPIERPIMRAPSLESLITVDEQGDTVKVTVVAPIRGEHGQLLQDYLRALDSDKKVVVDFGATEDCSHQSGQFVLMAARLRKSAGAPPVEIRNVPDSLSRVFNPSYGPTIGFTLSAT